MKWLKRISWAVVSLVAAIALSVIAGIVNPGEKVNALWIVIAAMCIYAMAFRYYSAFIAGKVLSLDTRRTVPSTRLNDGIDYYPMNRWVLFGHHFAAISGAGPIIGPILAAQFGYLPGFLWILIGGTLGGAVHDMIILASSVRRNGKSLAQIVKDEIGPIAGVVTALIILFNIVVAVSGSGLAVVNALAKSPWGTFTVTLTIPIAILMGIYMIKLRPGKVHEVSTIGAILLVLAVYVGHFIPGSFLAPFFNLSKNSLIIFICMLSFLCSALPVWLLLCPRDYISTYIKIGTFLLMALGIFLTAPPIQMPQVTIFAKGGGPIIPGTLYPFLFITIACGAISGFHGLVASGTTPKMLMSEKDVRLIGYGAMLMESLVAVMALVTASVLIPGDYFAISTKLSFEALSELGFPVGKIAELSKGVGVDLAGRPGGPVSLAVGMASILSSILGKKALLSYWYNFALMFQALFILTLVDTGTRVGRFLLQEIGGHFYKPSGTRNGMLNILITSFLIVALWGTLIFTGSISTIWPMFGVANQLLAALAFGIGTTLLIKAGNVKYIWITSIPMVFMFVTTFTAAWKLIGIFLEKAANATTFSEAFTLRIDAILVFLIALLAVIFLVDMFYKCCGYLINRRKITTSEIFEYSTAEIAG